MPIMYTPDGVEIKVPKGQVQDALNSGCTKEQSPEAKAAEAKKAAAKK